MEEVSVIGAGPAGAAAAAVLAKRGYRVRVYEAHSRPGVKPCGRGIPSTRDLPVRIPRDSIVRRVVGAKLYVDGEEVFDLEGELEGYIVDKASMLHSIIVESGAEPVYKAYYKNGRVRVGGRVIEPRRALLAVGHGYYSGEKIDAVQYRMKGRLFEDLDKLLIYFDTELIGYYWIFPARGDEADVGVGGYASAQELFSMLDRFVASNELTRDAKILKREGAKIAVGGLRLGTLDGHPLIGEAAGFVLPLTGEGIRPSMISGAAAAEALAEGKDPLRAMRKTRIASGIETQRRILERVKLKTPAERRRLLKKLPLRYHVRVALGEIGSWELLLVRILLRLA